jgi:hypothetical protein
MSESKRYEQVMVGKDGYPALKQTTGDPIDPFAGSNMSAEEEKKAKLNLKQFREKAKKIIQDQSHESEHNIREKLRQLAVLSE